MRNEAGQGNFTVRVPLTIKKRGGRKVVIAASAAEDGATSKSDTSNASTIKAMARAHRWQRLLESGTYATMRDLAKAEKIPPSYVSRLMNLTLLAPAIVETIINDQAAFSLGLAASENGWAQQVASVVAGEKH